MTEVFLKFLGIENDDGIPKKVITREAVRAIILKEEAEQGLTPVWLTVDEAIKENQKLLLSQDAPGWILREKTVLTELSNELLGAADSL